MKKIIQLLAVILLFTGLIPSTFSADSKSMKAKNINTEKTYWKVINQECFETNNLGKTYPGCNHSKN